MKTHNIIKFSDLETSDLIVDAIYQGGTDPAAGIGNEPISRLIKGSGNQGGFRYVGQLENFQIKMCVLYSSLSDPDWPDTIDLENGRLTYYGDNKHPGHELHDTPKNGNNILSYYFSQLHLDKQAIIPPFFIFTKGFSGRDVIFRGLAVPGAPEMNSSEDLIAISKIAEGHRFQNYKALFTILNTYCIKRAWLDDLQNGIFLSGSAPKQWTSWIKSKKYEPLTAERTKKYRSIKEQLPSNTNKKKIVQCIIDYFKNHPMKEYAFEKCAAEITKLMDKNILSYDLTRPWRDGGRDAFGKYRIGTPDSSITVDFALEAKCKQLDSQCGVGMTSRLISRLRYRQFGIFITTSVLGPQAYMELIEDDQPVIVISAEDIANILINSGYKDEKDINKWLIANFS